MNEPRMVVRDDQHGHATASGCPLTRTLLAEAVTTTSAGYAGRRRRASAGQDRPPAGGRSTPVRASRCHIARPTRARGRGVLRCSRRAAYGATVQSGALPCSTRDPGEERDEGGRRCARRGPRGGSISVRHRGSGRARPSPRPRRGLASLGPVASRIPSTGAAAHPPPAPQHAEHEPRPARTAAAGRNLRRARRRDLVAVERGQAPGEIAEFDAAARAARAPLPPPCEHGFPRSGDVEFRFHSTAASRTSPSSSGEASGALARLGASSRASSVRQ